MKKLLCIILSVLLLFTACKDDTENSKQKTYTMTRGINLSALESIFKPNSFLDKEKTFIEISKKGFDHVRLPVDFRNYCNSDGVISDSFYKRLDNIIKMATDNGLIVMLDFHGWYDFNIGKGDNVIFTKIWQNLAEHFKDFSKDALMFELINEPHTTEGGDLDAENLWNLQNSVIGEIRKIDPMRTIVVAMPEWNGPWTLDNFKNYDFENLIVAIHTYEPLDFTHQGEAWAGKGDIKLELTDEMLLSLNNQLHQILKFRLLTGHEVILNEFGLVTTGAISSEDVSKYLSYITKSMEAHGVPWTYWSYSGSFGVYNDGFLGIGKGWRQNVIDALMNT